MTGQFKQLLDRWLFPFLLIIWEISAWSTKMKFKKQNQSQGLECLTYEKSFILVTEISVTETKTSASHMNTSKFLWRKKSRDKISETEPALLTGLVIWRGPQTANSSQTGIKLGNINYIVEEQKQAMHNINVQWRSWRQS